MSSLQQVTARHTGGTAGCIPCIQQNERDRIFYLCICCCSVAQWCPTLCHSMNCSTPGFLVLHYLPEFAQTQVRESVMPSNHLIFCHFLLLLPSIFPSIRDFSSELALHIQCPKYWSFRFSISPFSEYSGLISFRADWFDLLAVQGTLNSLLKHRFPPL